MAEALGEEYREREKMIGLNNKKSKIKLYKPARRSFNEGWVKYKFEALSLVLISFFMIALFSLISFSAKDQSWFFVSSNPQVIKNLCGQFGANLSALLFYLFGMSAYLFLFSFVYVAYILFVVPDGYNKILRVASFLTLSFLTAILFSSLNLDLLSLYPGGLFGSRINSFLKFFMGSKGTIIFALISIFCTSVIAANVSFAYLFKLFLNFVFFTLKTSFLFIVKNLSLFLFFLFDLIVFGFKKAWAGIVYWATYIFRKDSSRDPEEFILNKNYFASSWENVDESGQTIPGKPESGKPELGKLGLDGSMGMARFSFESLKNIVVTKEDLENIINNARDFFDTLREKTIYTKSRAYNINKFSLLLLPNSVLDKNIFTKDLAEKLVLLNVRLKKLNASTLAVPVEAHVRQSFSDGVLREGRVCSSEFFEKFKNYVLPDINIFQSTGSDAEKIKKQLQDEGELKGRLLEEKLSYFGIKGRVTAIKPGPVITLFEYKPDIDSKISKIIALEDDLALALMALSIRIVAPIPGRSVVGFEISNKIRQNVFLSDLLKSDEFESAQKTISQNKVFSTGLPVVLGVDIVGKPVIQNLTTMPHLLVAGSTGSGKSVGLNTMLVSLLCNFKPDRLKLILIDPKRLEFAPYKDIPHLIFPIITNPRSASPVLKWLVQEMEERYDKMSQVGARNISEYQQMADSDKDVEPMPFIVLIIDELADLMMVAGKDVEIHIARIAQMARAAGIHMIIATQRPSVDVITGLIKVNFPSRIAFRVTSKIDSRTILDGSGAEKLLGRGDMLVMNSISSDLQRVHGAFVSSKEIEKLASFLKTQAKPEYLDLNETLKEMNKVEVEQIEDALYPDVLEFIQMIDDISISGLQRRYRIGFNRSARIIEKLELDGLLAPAQGSKPRKILKENL